MINNINKLLDAVAHPFLSVAPWILRLSLGISFTIHGYDKFPLPPEKMVGWFTDMGYAFPELVTSLVAIGEVAAGVGIILGGLYQNKVSHFITRLSGGAIVVIMIGAFAIAHPDWFITPKLFKSEQIFLLVLGAYFAIKGNN
tara:strand:+ start:677 stop:1102 length:426 start_codon:yes stop_codon:yes gene_type:complete